MKICITKSHKMRCAMRVFFIALLFTTTSLTYARSACCQDKGWQQSDCDVHNYSDGCEWDNAKCVYYGLPIRSAVSSTQR